MQATDEMNESAGIVMPVLMDSDSEDESPEGLEEIGDSLPILPVRNLVLFPGVAVPITVGRTKSMRLVREAMQEKKLFGVLCQQETAADDPRFEDLYHTGTVAEVLRILEMPDGSTTAILQGRRRFRLHGLTETEPVLTGQVTVLENATLHENNREFEALVSAIRDLTVKILMTFSDSPRDLIFSIRNNRNSFYLINFSCCNLLNQSAEKQELLAIDDLKERAYRLMFILNREYQLIELKASIQMKTHEEINKQQREYFLQQQIKNIQEELGGNINEIEIRELREKAKRMKWSKPVAETFEKELKKLERLHPQSPDYATQTQYVQTVAALPWNEYSRDSFNLRRAQRILDRDHFGMEKVKDRIIEHLAVLKLKNDLRSPILCLYGPPGVGKTSLGKSVAEALNREYVRVSLGGLHDEAEIRGHRRTYIGAMAGRIIQSLLKAGTSNPVFILDEIDKMGNDFRGDPAAALLEVLDPEQNGAFHDNYLDIDFDLSRVMFIATANSLSSISQPLLDRMELIEMNGYIMEEKTGIVTKHLLPKQMELHGIPKNRVKFPRATLHRIIESYTRESGVRELEKKIAKIMRRLARRLASEEMIPDTLRPESLEEYLGMEEYARDRYQGNQYTGVVTGLAWTAAGGEILYVESSLSRGKGNKLTVTGNLGDVMKESAVLALEYVHAHAEYFQIAEDMFEQWNVHIHVPQGAIPKDGPSAGITMVTSLVSVYTRRRVRENLAMTGEITLRGKVLPVGGIKEKILAAKRAGIREIILSQANRKDIREIKPAYLEGLTFHHVEDIAEVVRLALLPA
jgi:ATP-dependent Lon protease